MFRSRRQRRYIRLRKAGFLPFEARALSKVPLKIPYLRMMTQERRQEFNRAIKDHWTLNRWLAVIRQRYITNSWTFRTRLGKRVCDPWFLLRSYEDKYRATHPAYVSPWEKHQRDFRLFIQKLENTIAKYPARMPQVELRYLEGGGAEIVRR